MHQTQPILPNFLNSSQFHRKKKCDKAEKSKRKGQVGIKPTKENYDRACEEEKITSVFKRHLAACLGNQAKQGVA